MRRILLRLVLGSALLLGTAGTTAAQQFPFCAPGQVPTFVFGFGALKENLGDIMGEPLECEHVNPENGDSLQQTTTGLAFYRKATNTPTFTDGFRHWALTAQGLVFWTGESIDPPPDAMPVPPPALMQQTVDMQGLSFVPQTLTIGPNVTVTWINGDKEAHTVTADDGSYDSGLLEPGQSFSLTFTEPGVYPYHCTIHGAPRVGMFGTIIVSES